MNKEEKKYVLERVQQIVAAKKKAIDKKLSQKYKGLTFDERVRLINSGKVKLLPRVCSYSSLMDAFDFSKYDNMTNFSKEKESLLSAIDKKAIDIKDEIMLTGCEDASRLIKELEAM